MQYKKYDEEPTDWLHCILVCVASVTLILSNYWLINQFNVIYRNIFVCLIFLCLFVPQARVSFLSLTGIGILSFAAILALMLFAGHGDRLVYSLSSLGKNMPFFSVGYLLANRQSVFRRLLIAPILMIYSILGIQYTNTISGVNVTSRLEVATFFADDPRSMVVSLITHFPTMVLVFILSIAMFSEKNRVVLFFSLCSAGLLLWQVFFSFWTSPQLMLVFGFIVAFIQLICKRSVSVELKLNSLFVIVLLTAFVAVGVALMEQSGQAGERVIERGVGFLSAIFQSDSIIVMDYHSAGRLSRIVESLNVFSDNLFFGNGDYWWQGAGGHSLWFDSLAKYGLIGSLPLFLFAVSSLFYSWRNYNSLNAEWIDYALMIFLSVWFFSAFLNPYLFGRPGYFIFLAIGMVTGRYKFICAEQLNENSVASISVSKKSAHLSLLL